MNLAEINKLKSNICSILDKKDNSYVDLNTLTIDNIVHKYSNTKVPLYRFIINDCIIKKNNHYMVNYKCLHCDREVSCALNNITRKINRGITKCRTCKELDEHKRLTQSIFMSNGGKSSKKKVEKPSIYEKIQSDILAFEDMDDDWKDNYFRRHMTSEEFEYIKPKIKSIQRGRIQNIDTFEYCPIVSISNQTRFNPYLYDREKDCIEKITDIEVTCDSCKSSFQTKNLVSHKNKLKCLCRDCNLTNNVFKIRTYHNVSNEPILYQSKFELKFIRYCNEHKIKITNGPKIPYIWNEKTRVYRVDFYIPKLNILIEIKDNHIWYKEQITTGKWGAKLDGVHNYTQANGSEFMIIFPKNYVNLTKKLFKKYWDNR